MRKYLSNLLLTLASATIFFVILEIALALFWPHKINDMPLFHEQYDPVMGWVNKPNVDGDYHLTRSDSFHRKHNSKGLRSLREIDYAKPAGVKRVLLLGDSCIWGYGVNDEDIISEVLQKKTGPGIEIINGAASGYGTDQELLWLMKEGLKYEPDLVVLGFFAANDWQDISQSISYGYPSYPRPFFSLEKGRLTATNIPVPDTRALRSTAFNEPQTIFEKIKKFLRHRTHTYPFIAIKLNSVPGMRRLFLRLGLANRSGDELRGIPVMTHSMKDILPLSEALIREIRYVSKKAGADFLLVFIPEKETIPGAAQVYDAIIPGAETRNTEASRYFSTFTAKLKMRYLDLLPVIRELQTRGETLYKPQAYDPHWTPAGHRVAAEALYAWLRDHQYAGRADAR